MFATPLGARPVLGAAEVNQDTRRRMHTVSLPVQQRGGQVRHDTPVNPWGTRPESKTSDRVDIRNRGAFAEMRRAEDGGAMNATLTSPELTRADRCDRCGAAARVRAKLPSGAELLFCQHHANEHEAKLVELAAVLETSPAEV
jgi:hypothetical protein